MAENEKPVADALAVGMALFTQDGDHVGEVAEIRTGEFRLKDDRGRDRWFGLFAVQSIDEDGAVVKFEDDDLDTPAEVSRSERERTP